MVAGEILINRQLTGYRDARWFSYEKRAMLLLAFKTAMAAGICYWLATLVHLQDGYWGSISAIIVLQSHVGSTVSASRDRLIGTLIGAAFGAVFSLLGTGLWAYLLAVITAMVTCGLLGLKNSARLAGVTVTILMLVHRTASGFWANWTLPLHRVLEVLFGIIVALVISTLVFPDRARLRLQDGLAQEFLLMGALFEAIFQGFHGTMSPDLAHIRREVESLTSSNNQLRESACNEPSSGKASLEALLLLAQLGRELQEILRALELATRGKDGDDFAAQLEPELGKLVNDIHFGFEYIAGCIHRWRFNLAPEDLSLTQDIEALERKMAAIRPTVSAFNQAEILRAYAVQLHLKDLARRLKIARIESAGMLSAE